LAAPFLKATWRAASRGAARPLVDPQRDTPEALKVYLQSFNPGIPALTGSPAQIAATAAQFDAAYARSDGENGHYSYDHSTKTYFVTHGRRLLGTLDLQQLSGRAFAFMWVTRASAFEMKQSALR
jgi:protein SCO1